jgi:Tol biopolymer transport system component
VWSADGVHITFQSDRDGAAGLFRQRADGAASVERLTTPGAAAAHVPHMWSPKGEVLMYSTVTGSTSSLWMLSYADRKTAAVGDIRGSISANAAFSPDSKWIAYQSVDGGRRAIFVEPFPVTGNKFLLATGESVGQPLWAPDGSELFFASGPTQLSALSIATSPRFRFGNPVRVDGQRINEPAGARNYDIAKDGKTFLGIVETDGTGASDAGEIRVVLNWFEELRQRVPVKAKARD